MSSQEKRKVYVGLPWWLSDKESTCQCRRLGLDPWLRKIPWRRKWQPILVFLPGKSHGQRSPADNNPWGRKRIGHDLVTKQQHMLPFGKEHVSVCLCPSQLKTTGSNSSACAACLVHGIQPSDARGCAQPVLFNCWPSSSSSTLCPHLTWRRKRLLHLFNRQLATSQKLPIGGEHPSVFIWVLSAEIRLY